MINSLFSSFDPSRSYKRINYLVLFSIVMVPFFNKVFIKKINKEIFLTNINNILINEIKIIINNTNLKDKLHLLIRLFFSLILLNLVGLIPYIFRITSQIIYTLNLALPFWLSFILFNLKNSHQKFFAHLVPNRTPIILSHFIVLIESVRQLIRPITLSVRLAANITAGHILITLIRKTIIIINFISFALLLLFILELAVAFIQSYVFILLTSAYIKDSLDLH